MTHLYIELQALHGRSRVIMLRRERQVRAAVYVTPEPHSTGATGAPSNITFRVITYNNYSNHVQATIWRGRKIPN